MRIYYYDNIKGFLILCVVCAHTLSTCSEFYNYDHSFMKLVFFFMMPLFIFVTGIFAKKSKRSPIKRALKMLLIYLIAQTVVTFYYTNVLGIIDSDKSFLIPRFTLWYLLTCATLYLSEYIFTKFKFKNFFLVSIAFALLSGFIEVISDTLSLSRTITLLPFFLLGYHQDEIDLLTNIKKHRKIVTILVIGITIWFLWHQNFFLFKDTYFKYNYFDYGDPLDCFIKRILLYLISFVFCIFILNNMSKDQMFFSKLGNKTLMIYLLHGVILKTFLHYNIFINNEVLGTIVTFFIVLISSLVLGNVLKKIISKIKEQLLNIHYNILNIFKEQNDY